MNLVGPTSHPGRAFRAAPEVRKIGRDWRAANPIRSLDPDAAVTFGIALISRERAYDWERVQHTLAITLGSLIAQTDPRWEAIVCCQDRPEVLAIDPRIRFQRFDAPPAPNAISDNLPKHRAMIEAMGAEFGRDGYLFSLDADDLLHPDLVGHFLRTAEPGGYLVTDGYMMDVRSGAIALLSPQSLADPLSIWHRRGAFNIHCGSSSAIRFDRRDGPSYLTPLTNRGRHRRRHHHLAAFGLKLARVPFPAAIYVVNHGENLRERRGLLGSKVDYANRYRLRPEEEIAVRSAFGLEGSLSWLAAPASLAADPGLTRP